MTTSNPITDSQNWKQLRGLVEDTQNAKYKKAFEDVEQQINQYMNLIHNLQTEIDQQKENTERNKKQIETLNDLMIEMKRDLDLQKKLRLISDCNALANTFIVYGINFHHKALNEKRAEINSETSEMFKKTMEQIDVNMIELGSFDSYRLPTQTKTDKDGKDYQTNGIKITLLNQRGRQLIYTALKKNGKALKSFRIQQAIPRELIPVKNTMEKIAKNIRETVKNTKTRVQCRRGEISITTKNTEKNEATFTKINRKMMEGTIKNMIKKDDEIFDEIE